MEANGSDLNFGLATQVQKILFPKTSPICEWGNIGLKNRVGQGVGGDQNRKSKGHMESKDGTAKK